MEFCVSNPQVTTRRNDFNVLYPILFLNISKLKILSNTTTVNLSRRSNSLSEMYKCNISCFMCFYKNDWKCDSEFAC